MDAGGLLRVRMAPVGDAPGGNSVLVESMARMARLLHPGKLENKINYSSGWVEVEDLPDPQSRWRNEFIFFSPRTEASLCSIFIGEEQSIIDDSDDILVGLHNRIQ